MNIAYYHASKFGNGAMVAEEFKKIMAARGVTVSVQHIRDANPQDLPRADLYVFSSPGRMGKPKGNVRRFLRKVTLEPGTRYAILTTQDHVISPELQRWMYKRSGAKVTEVSASHAVFISQPDAVARVIEAAAKQDE